VLPGNFDAGAMSRRGFLNVGASLGVLALGSAAQTLSAANAPADRKPGLDFSTAEDNLHAFVKMVAGLESGREHCGYYKGTIVASLGKDEKNVPLFGYEGFGMSRVTKLPDGRYENLHREVSYYTDLETGEILEEWFNPFIKETVKVWPVHNDPVNSYYATKFRQTFGEKGKEQTVEWPFILPWIVIGDRAIASFEVHTRWASPLTKDKWPREYGGQWYKTSEMFQLHTSLAALNDPDLMRAPYTGAWTKEAPWIPWMLMEEKPGRLFYVTAVLPLESTDALPKRIREYTEKRFPQHLRAPDQWTSPNVTTFEQFSREAKPVPYPKAL
jgi:hypothetical protein